MANLLNGLAHDVRQEIEKTGVIDFTHLKPEDIARAVPRGEIDVDWQSLLFVKNNRPADTIVLTENDGFFRTPLAPRELVNMAVDSTDKTWHDYHTNVALLNLSGPTPIVSGNLQLLVTEQPKRKNQTSWVGIQAVERVNAVSEKRVRVQLKDGMEMIFRDTDTRLRKKIKEASAIKRHLIKEHQESLRHFAPDDYQNATKDSFDGRAFRLERVVIIVSACMTVCNHPKSRETIRQVVCSVLRGNREIFHLEDEQY